MFEILKIVHTIMLDLDGEGIEADTQFYVKEGAFYLQGHGALTDKQGWDLYNNCTAEEITDVNLLDPSIIKHHNQQGNEMVKGVDLTGLQKVLLNQQKEKQTFKDKVAFNYMNKRFGTLAHSWEEGTFRNSCEKVARLAYILAEEMWANRSKNYYNG